MTNKSDEFSEHSLGREEMIFLRMIADAINMCAVLCHVDEVVALNSIAHILGENAACLDDKVGNSKGYDGSKDAMRQMVLANFNRGYDMHVEVHEGIKRSMKEGEDFVKKVCESHKLGRS